MKKRIFLIFTLVMAVVLLSSCTGRKAQNEGYKLYRSSPVGVEIEYPDFWEIAEDKTNKTVAFATPSEGYGDEYRDNVSICSYELDSTNEMAYDNFVTKFIEDLPKTIVGYNLVSEGEYAVGEYDAYRVVYEGTTDDGALRNSHTLVNGGSRVYVYTFSAEPKSYDYFNANSEIMISTFKVVSK